jgi:hypothetical protein
MQVRQQRRGSLSVCACCFSGVSMSWLDRGRTKLRTAASQCGAASLRHLLRAGPAYGLPVGASRLAPRSVTTWSFGALRRGPTRNSARWRRCLSQGPTRCFYGYPPPLAVALAKQTPQAAATRVHCCLTWCTQRVSQLQSRPGVPVKSTLTASKHPPCRCLPSACPQCCARMRDRALQT